MLTVYKVTLEIANEQKVELQKGSSIIKVGEQDGHIVLWYICDPERNLDQQTFYVVGTGQQLPDTFPGVYVGSVQIYDMPDANDPVRTSEHVWHVFFKKRPNVQRGRPIVTTPKGDGNGT